MIEKVYLSILCKILIRALIFTLSIFIAERGFCDSKLFKIHDLEVSKFDSSISLAWSDISCKIFGKAEDIDSYGIYRSKDYLVKEGVEKSFSKIDEVSNSEYIELGVLLVEEDFFYYVTVISECGAESLLPSNIGYKIHMLLPYNPLGENNHWFSLPYNSDYTTASDIGSDAPNISQVIRWNPETQTENVWNQIEGTGVDFPIVPGEAYAVVITDDTVINLVGAHKDVSFNWTYNEDNFNINWLSLPFPNAYGSASLLAQDIPNATKVARYDSANDTYQSWFKLDGVWMGEDFPLVPGEAVLVVIDADTTWTPSTGTPVATATADADHGFNSLTVNLSGNAEDKNGSIAKYQWDFEGDGSFDFEDSDSPDASFTYTEAGVFHPTLLVTDNDGFRNYDYQTVEMHSIDASFSIYDFNPSQGEGAQFSITVSSDGSLTVGVFDQADALVRSLASSQAVTAGEAVFDWDGKNDLGETVADGVYYVVVEYAVAGTTYVYTFDLRDGTGGVGISDSVEQIEVSGNLSPLTGQYVDITYDLPQKAQVSIQIRNISGALIRRLIDNAPRFSGSHTERWDGADDDGTFVPPGTSFYAVVSAVSLADNALIVSGSRPELFNVAASPLRFSPSSNPYGTQDKSTMVATFTLNKQAEVTAYIYGPSGALVRTIVQADMLAGQGQIAWNGRNENGVMLSAGKYTVQLVAEDGNGLSSEPFNIQSEIFY